MGSHFGRTLSISLLLTVGLIGSIRADVSLKEMGAAIDSLGRYEVHFRITDQHDTSSATEEENGVSLVGGVEGSYRVEGDRFLLTIGKQQIFGDGVERTTIDHAQCEVILERLTQTDNTQPLLATNPATTFTSLEELFEVDSATSEESDGGVETALTRLRLTPKSEAAIVDSSVIEIDNKTRLPRSITYRANTYDDVADGIKVTIISIDSTTKSIEAIYPPTYEIIDIR